VLVGEHVRFELDADTDALALDGLRWLVELDHTQRADDRLRDRHADRLSRREAAPGLFRHVRCDRREIDLRRACTLRRREQPEREVLEHDLREVRVEAAELHQRHRAVQRRRRSAVPVLVLALLVARPHQPDDDREDDRRPDERVIDAELEDVPEQLEHDECAAASATTPAAGVTAPAGEAVAAARARDRDRARREDQHE